MHAKQGTRRQPATPAATRNGASDSSFSTARTKQLKQLLEHFLRSIPDEDQPDRPITWLSAAECRANVALQQMCELRREEQAELVSICIQRALKAHARVKDSDLGDILYDSTDRQTSFRSASLIPVRALMRRRLPLTPGHLAILADAASAGLVQHGIGTKAMLRMFQQAAKEAPLPAEVCQRLRVWHDSLANREQAPLRKQLRMLFAPDEPPAPASAPAGPALTCPTEAEMMLLAAARDVGTAATGGEHADLERTIDPIVWNRLTPVNLLRLIANIGKALLGPFGTCKGPAHLARFVLDCDAFANTRATYPRFSAAAQPVFHAFCDLRDEQVALALDELDSYLARWRTYDSVCMLAETLALADRVQPSFQHWFQEWFPARQRETDCPEWGRHFERLQAEFAGPSPTVIYPGDAWADAALGRFERASPAMRERWLALFRHAQRSSASPTRAWLTQAGEHGAALGRTFAPAVLAWLRLIGARGMRHKNIYGWPPDATYLMDVNNPVLRGLMFAAALRPTAEVAAALGDAAVVCDQKVLRLGPRCALIRNAAVTALGLMPLDIAGPQIARIDQQLKYKAGRKRGEQTLAAAARACEISPDEFVEQNVPTYDLDETGEARSVVGSWTATLAIRGSRAALSWLSPDGSEHEAPASEVARRQGGHVQSVMNRRAEIDGMLRAHTLRMERLLCSERVWRLDDWRRWYGDHPLLRHIARRLIWTLQCDERRLTGMLASRGWIDSSGRPLRSISGDSPVCPWHPAQSTPSEVRAWRSMLTERRSTQPFKQAHREVYLLTDAEREAGDASSRFASHILRAAQFVSLLHIRGWEGNPASAFDAAYDQPRLRLPAWNLIAELQTQPFEEEPGERGFDHIVTGRVLFRRSGYQEGIRLTDVPPLIFSEIMRDIDLFVSVCSVGTDPEWEHRNEVEGGAYWNWFATGELSASAQARRDQLRDLLPRLGGLSPVAEVDGRFLRVRGKLREYKIHLGSGNILMEPNDEYLCIVPSSRDRAAGEGVFLPFEGDRVLAIILSKALMLAEDDKIKDRSILAQIKGR